MEYARVQCKATRENKTRMKNSDARGDINIPNYCTLPVFPLADTISGPMGYHDDSGLVWW